MYLAAAAAAAESLQSCPTLCDPIEGSPPGSLIPGILQARALEWVAISYSSAWKWKVKVKSLSHVQLFATPWTSAYQAPLSMGFSRQEYRSGVPLPSPLCILQISKCPEHKQWWFFILFSESKFWLLWLPWTTVSVSPAPWGLRSWLSGKEFNCQFRRWGFSPWVGKIFWRRKWQLTPVFLPGKCHGQRSLVGYSPCSHKKLDTT